ncbi:uncharacterized protein [Drosophila kikkawai]|uniref:Uncharacterized protein n=1 Tax=Drosophila kikkawai TaxID=30033 RepID=A0A6P4I7N2_DROKI|nr:uncharacterized protein LOC108076025 [Drosophila kikkawai]
MILFSPINLFFYNIAVAFIDSQYKKTIDVSNEALFWHKIPIVNRFMDIPEKVELPDPNDILLEINPYVNAFILLPAIFKHYYFKILLVMVLIWNIIVCKRIISFFIRLLTILWASDLCWGYYLAILLFVMVMSLAHVVLMYYTAKSPLLQAIRWGRYG